MGTLRYFIPLLLLYQNVAAVLLYVASYSGNLTTLSLSRSPKSYTGFTPSNDYNLTVLSTFNTNTQNPSWLRLNSQGDILYLADRNSTVASYRTSTTGHLAEIQRVKAPAGGVYISFFSSGSAIAVPHYVAGVVQTYSVTSTGTITPLQRFSYNLSAPGPIPWRQEAPHPHQTITDPTGQYLLVPDLGADLVRIYAIGTDSLLTELTPFTTPPGSGPRHGAFSRDTIPADDGTQNYIFYLASELAVTVTAYRVTYLPSLGGLRFEEIATYPSLGPGHPVPPNSPTQQTGVTSGIELSPDGEFVIVSNRRDESFIGEQYSPNGTSDSLAFFSIQRQGGALDFMGLVPAGGAYPRQFSINKAGNLVAVGLQEGNRVTILERDIESGRFKGQVAEVDVEGPIICVIWDD
ncbi:putative isomerase YbhE [Zopfia rhizophila CBS 207.26]|uniref:Putative isomerase YbhE n=1 Tax=Zopfia rhizophila CBS 207.26 TaxID=1314779 RepID=A0A6A6DKC2_9PEZI|nr:putative isomerase YbhE [Zopfia rhizophila CBS 207.26]